MEARCQCGQLRVRVPGPSDRVVACHCTACQRRTGSPFGAAAYYPHAQVKVEGVAQRYERATHQDGMFENYFCPDCGSTVFFESSQNEHLTGVALGAFVDPHDMTPVASLWEKRKHAWVTIPTATDHRQMERDGGDASAVLAAAALGP